jgi:hypothetical protein
LASSAPARNDAAGPERRLHHPRRARNTSPAMLSPLGITISVPWRSLSRGGYHRRVTAATTRAGVGTWASSSAGL